jgi:hypothetical protein
MKLTGQVPIAARLWLLIDPVEGAMLVGNEVVFTEPQGNLLFGTLHRIRAVTDIATNIDGIVEADSPRG